MGHLRKLRQTGTDIIGKIVITTTPFRFRGFKYRVHIRSENTISPQRFEEIMDYSVHFPMDVPVELREVKKLPDERVWDAAAQYDREHRVVPPLWHRYEAYLRTLDDEEMSEVEDHILKLLESEMGGRVFVEINSVKWMPSEKLRVKTVPISKDLFDRMLAKRKESAN